MKIVPPAKALHKAILSFHAAGLSQDAATILGAITHSKGNFVWDTIPKSLFAQDELFCEHFIKHAPRREHWRVRTSIPYSDRLKEEVICALQQDPYAGAYAPISFMRHIPAFAEVCVFYEPRLMGSCLPEIHHNPLLAEEVQKQLTLLKSLFPSDFCDERETDLRMLMAKGNGWAHPPMINELGAPMVNQLGETLCDPRPLLALHAKPPSNRI